MRKIFVSMLFGLLFSLGVNAQSLSIVKGTVSDGESAEKLAGVTVSVQGTSIEQKSDSDGNFVLQNVPVGKQVVLMSFGNYKSQSFPVNVIDGKEVDLGIVLLYKQFATELDLSTITLSDEDLLDEEGGGSDNVSGLLVSSKDAFLNAAEVDDFKIEVEANLTDEHPKYYDKVHVIYKFYGSDFKKDKIEKSVNLSVERYCGVMEMFRKFSEISTEIIYIEQ